MPFARTCLDPDPSTSYVAEITEAYNMPSLSVDMESC
jgi:hypothetical protein